jgi:hypothetical protein
MSRKIQETVEIIDVERDVSMRPEWTSPMQEIKIKRTDGTVEVRVDNEVGLGPFGFFKKCGDKGRDWEKDKGNKVKVTLRDNIWGKRIEKWINTN